MITCIQFRSLNFNPNLQNLIMGPNELDDSNDKGLKPKSVVIGGGGLLGRVHWSSLFDLKWDLSRISSNFTTEFWTNVPKYDLNQNQPNLTNEPPTGGRLRRRPPIHVQLGRVRPAQRRLPRTPRRHQPPGKSSRNGLIAMPRYRVTLVVA